MTTETRVTTYSDMRCGECGLTFLVPDHFKSARIADKKGWCCPNGHSRVFVGETAADKAQRLAGQLDQERTRRAQVEKQLDYARRTQKATSTRLKKVKARVAHGVCPCCTRSFQNLARHMETKHPSYGKEAAGD